MAGADWAARVLTSEARLGLQVTLHRTDPGNNGSGVTDGPYNIAAANLAVVKGVLTNTRDVIAGTTTGSGRVRYVGIWASDGLFITKAKLTTPRDLVPGAPLRFRRHGLRLDVSD